jgi:hypothetical protein
VNRKKEIGGYRMMEQNHPIDSAMCTAEPVLIRGCAGIGVEVFQ